MHQMKQTLLKIFITIALCLTFAGSVEAGRIGLSWQGSSSASGYRVYFGPSEGDYFSQPLYDGPSTAVELSDSSLVGCTTWHFVVTAYNTAGESGFSPSVASWTRPEVADTTPADAIQGEQIVMTIEGDGFSPDAVFSIDNPEVRFENATIDCDAIQLVATVEPTGEGVQPAEIGGFTITVTNPDGLTDSLSDAFEVGINPGRFDVNQTSSSTDGRVDGLDTIWMATLFGSQFGDSEYDPDFDFDGDGWVDGTDLAHLGSNFGRCWDGAAWKVSACD
jgi:hypothetical protein